MTGIDIKNQLENLWKQDYINGLPDYIKKRGFAYSENNSEKDILITGINPSFREGEKEEPLCFDFNKILQNEKWDNYWGPVKKILFDNNIDLRDKCAYLDIFYFREKEQRKLRNEILKSDDGVRFLVEQLKITQHVIEDVIKPKLILVKNRESEAYWGKLSEQSEQRIIWMGYQLEKQEKYSCGELYRISGLIDATDRILHELKETNLKGSLILFSGHINQYTKREKRPTASIINELLTKVKK